MWKCRNFGTIYPSEVITHKLRDFLNENKITDFRIVYIDKSGTYMEIIYKN